MADNEDFVRSIEDATLAIVRQTAANMDRACLLVEAEAKRECPVDQGVLRASMFSKVKTTVNAIVGIVANSSEIAPYVHQGTGIYAKDGNGRRTPWVYVARAGKYKGGHITQGQRPQPFLQNARDSKRDAVNRILGGE